MICRSCLLRAPAAAASTTTARLSLLPRRAFSLTHAIRADASPPSPPPAAAPAASDATAATTSAPDAAAAATADTETPPLTTPYSSYNPTGGPVKTADMLKPPSGPKSSCLPGTPLEGLNYYKDRTDPVALPDEEYPDWLWTILDREEKEVGTGDAGEFSKSKKERKLALKKARLREEEAIASGNIDALAPKIPFQHQSINLPGNEAGSIADAVHAAQQREKLRRAMRKERMVAIREQNYLSTI